MENDIKRLEDKLDKVVDKISNIDVTLAKQHGALEEHMKRTDLLEQQVQPLKSHMDEFKGAIRFVKAIGVIVAIIEGIRHFLSMR